jgi:hypothetical protein
MLLATEIIPISHKAERGRDHRSDFLLRRAEVRGGDEGPWLRNLNQNDNESKEQYCPTLMRSPLSKAVLNTKSTTGIFPLNRTVNTGDLTGTAFQTTGIFDHHLSFLIQSIEICRAGINAKTFFAVMTDFLVKLDMGFLIVFKGIQGKFFSNLH